MKCVSLLSAMILGVSFQVAHATAITSGTGELVGFHPCIPGATSACDDFGLTGPDVAHFYAGLPGDPSSSTGLVTLGSLGAGSASATLGSSAVDGAPILRAYASAASGERVLATTAALQSYTWNGVGPATRTFGGALTYSQNVTGAYPDPVGEGVYAAIDVFTLSPATFDAGSTTEDNLTALVGGGYGLPGYTDLGFTQFSDTSSNPGGSADLTDTVALTPGETIWVWSVLQADGVNGGTTDASHTLITGWNDATGLTPAATVPVPEPASLALFAIGLAGCAVGAGRRKRRPLR